MFGDHIQQPLTNWPHHLTTLPDNTPIKAVDNVQALAEAKRYNPKLKTILRHWYDRDPGQVFDGSPYPVLLQRAAAFFATFIDGTFTQYAGSVDYVETFNETLANSQTPQEKQWRIDQERAMCEVWARDYKARYPHIKLILANTAIGNDIPWQYAQLATQYGHIIGYHAYIGVYRGAISPADERWLSGRWRYMDADFRARGYAVRWMITEGGPCRDYSGQGHLDPNAGWKHSEVCGGSLEKYKQFLGVFMDASASWNRQNNGRMLGGVLFTSGTDSTWESFNLNGEQWDNLAPFIKNYVPGNPPPPTTPPQPEISTRVQLLRPQFMSDSQWAKVRELMTIGINASLIGRSDTQNIAIGFEGWSHNDAYLAIKQSIEAGRLNSRLVVMDGDQIGTGLDRAWVNANWPDIASYVYFISSTAAAVIPPMVATNWPTPHRVVNQQFGANPQNYPYAGLFGHDGTDIRAYHGDPVYSIADGVVHSVYTQATGHNYGKHARINSTQGRFTHQIIYAHLDSVEVTPGQVVKGGQVIGRADNTGNSKGDHLHITYKVLGQDYIDAAGNKWGYNIFDSTPVLKPLAPGLFP